MENTTANPVIVDDEPSVVVGENEPDPVDEVVTPPVDTPVALFGPPQFITSECGSLTVATTTSSNSVTTPAELFVGEPVRGQIVPNSQSDNFHVWQVQLDAGNYHLVADTSDLGADKSAIGLEIEQLGETTADNERLVADSEFGYDLRLHEYLEIQSPQLLRFTVDASYDKIHNYTLGIFRNGTAVPSPTFENCLPMNSLSLDGTQSVVLQADDTREDDVWYQLDLEPSGYQLDASMSSVEDDAIGYGFVYLDQFGQHEREERISADSVFGNLLTTSDMFELDTAGTHWIRARNSYNDERTVEFTLTKP